MRHAVLGVGGVGGLIGAALARAGGDVILLLRSESIGLYPGHVAVESAVLGDFEVIIPAAATLDHKVDALWIATKAPQLEAALRLAPAAQVGGATVVPLLNGVDHVASLRRRYANVVAGAIRVESERLATGRIRQSSPFLRIDLAGAEPLAAELRKAGIACSVRADERTLLWNKLVFLAPLALATTAFDAPLGGVRADGRYHHCQHEVVAVAEAEGAEIDREELRHLSESAPDDLRSSLQKDVTAGFPSELEAICGPIFRGAEQSGIAIPTTIELAQLVERRIATGSAKR